MSFRVDHVVTAGTFSLDGGTWDVTNNVWLLGDDREVLVVDPAHDADAVLTAVAGRRVAAVVCTHAHDDHCREAFAVADQVDARVHLHPADAPLWDLVHPGRRWDDDLADGQTFDVGGTEVRVLHTPGHAPGAVCLHVADHGRLLSGDTLFAGGPGATGRSYSDFPTIIASIRERLLVLPADTVVHPGHGGDTTVGAEAPHLPEWVARGH